MPTNGGSTHRKTVNNTSKFVHERKNTVFKKAWRVQDWVAQRRRRSPNCCSDPGQWQVGDLSVYAPERLASRLRGKTTLRLGARAHT